MKLLLIIWQLPQYLLGLLVLAWHKLFMRKRFLHMEILWFGKEIAYYHVYNRIKYDGRYSGFSLGLHIFFYYNRDYMNNLQVSKANEWIDIKRHVKYREYAHSIQSLYLGWLYLPVIALPSMVMTSIGMHDKCYTEKWAERIINQLNK